MEKISVIVPIYNAESTIQRCITSLCNQLTRIPSGSNILFCQNDIIKRGGVLFDYEIVAIDDNSSDSTLDILNELKNKYSNLKVLHKPNGGAAAARKFGIESSESDYLAFCDADDYVEPDWLLTMYSYLKLFNADFSMITAYLNDRGLEKKFPTPYNYIEWTKDEAIRKFIEHRELNGILWTNLYKRELFDDLDWALDMNIFEDGYLVWQILQKVNRVVKVLVPKYHYMFTPGSLTNKKYDFDRYYSTRKLLDRIVDDCSHKKELAKFQEEADAMYYNWMVAQIQRIGYSWRNQEAEDYIQSIIRNGGYRRFSQLKSLKSRVIAGSYFISPAIARLILRLKSLKH